MTTRISHSDLQDGSVEQDLLPHSQTGIYYYCYCWEVSALSLFVSPNSVISYYPICPASHYKPIRGILFTLEESCSRVWAGLQDNPPPGSSSRV